ncbi:hypothetical protein PS732_04995 [Pseudomonas fluorescens]|uniref:SMODS and SLOG-associating 2TM effector domain-containing protein n=1 Tax=Pseudomonas fluorescens TaxID=294 RepID=A0ABD7VMR0_PSEFL|nr:hypothetical protein [Pseudomonas fluorescens]VVP42942.1 hypothetical protein PS732_04995 [Pseudomonas fluorescens]
MALADGLVVVSLVLSVLASAFLAYDAIWAPGARFQQGVRVKKLEHLNELIESQTVKINELPAVYTPQEKEHLILELQERLAPGKTRLESELHLWEKHPVRVTLYAFLGLLCLSIASILQGVVHFIGR